nr:unnamed protein product [Digitaria exilis]
MATEVAAAAAAPRVVASVTGSPGTVEEQQAAGVGILLQISMLVLSFVLGHILRRRKFYYLPEASGSLLIGMIVGGLANISNTQKSTRRWFNFREDFFLLFLLPPIILYPLLHYMLLFSKLLLVKFVMFYLTVSYSVWILLSTSNYIGGLVYIIYRLPLVECMMFGALVSATDPVTVLSIFQELGTDTNLYALVFGESVLNDAVAISLYRTMASMRTHPSGQNFFLVILRFLENFVGSMSSVTSQHCYSLIRSNLFKYAALGVENLHNLESCLFVLFPYFSYMLAEGIGLSGIVSILFTGSYTWGSILQWNAKAGHMLDSYFSQLYPSIIFILLARAANVFSCAYILNLARPPHCQIPKQYQQALWYSGLRGAMAFALALQSVHDLPDGHGETIFTATTSIVVLTVSFCMTAINNSCMVIFKVLLIGGSTGTMLEALQVVGDSNRYHQLYEVSCFAVCNSDKFCSFAKVVLNKKAPYLSYG